MSRVIVVEGTDGAGKTTLALAIAARFDYTYRWLGKPEKGEVWDFYCKAYCEYGSSERVVFDRSHWSEDVYGPLFRGGSELTVVESTTLKDILGDDVTLILCCRSIEGIKETLAETPDDLHHNEEPHVIQSKYFEVLQASGARLLYYDFNFESVEELMERIC